MLEIEFASGLADADFASVARNRYAAHRHIFLESEDWVDWKFNKSPFGRALVALIRDEKGEVVACNAYGILNYSMGGNIFKIAKPYETYVHNDYQGKGLFGRMLNKIKEEAGVRGLDGLLFFPNEASLGSLKASNDWMRLGTEIRYLVRPALSFAKPSKFIDIRKSFIPLRSDEHNGRSFRFRSYNLNNHTRISLNVTKEYLEWRFNKPTLNLYRKFTGENIEIVVREGARGRLSEAQIVFIGAHQSLNSQHSVRELANVIKALRAEFDLVGIPMSENNVLFSTLKSLGFFSLPSRTNVFVQPIGSGFGRKVDQLALTGLDFHTY